MQSPTQINGHQPVLWSAAGRWSIILFGLSIVCLLIFRSTEQIDIFVSDLFFTKKPCANPVEGTRCGRFLRKFQSEWQVAREAGHNLPLILMAATALHLFWLLTYNANKTRDRLYPPLVAVISALVGPLFVVNIVLKEYWGRPRPAQTQFFSGDNPYISPGNISSFCESNCSFVSGEAAAAFWMLSLVFYFKVAHRIWFVIATTLTASLIATLRVVFGRHYISDVVMAGLLVVLIIALTVWLLQTRRVVGWIDVLHQSSVKNGFGRQKK